VDMCKSASPQIMKTAWQADSLSSQQNTGNVKKFLPLFLDKKQIS